MVTRLKRISEELQELEGGSTPNCVMHRLPPFKKSFVMRKSHLKLVDFCNSGGSDVVLKSLNSKKRSSLRLGAKNSKKSFCTT